MNRVEESRILSELNELESQDEISHEQRALVIARLGNPAVVAFAARRAIIKAILHGAKSSSSVVGKRRRSSNITHSWNWLTCGFEWALSSSANSDGTSEWLALCVSVLKNLRSDSHPERAAGAADSQCDHEYNFARHAADACARLVVDNLSALWVKYRCLGDERYMVSLLSLTLGCVKLLAKHDVLIGLHSPPNGNASSASKRSSIKSSSDEEFSVTRGSQWPSVVYLNLPPLVIFFKGSAMATEESCLRAIDVLRILMQKSEVLVNGTEVATSLVVSLDERAASALNFADAGALTKTKCSFIGESGLEKCVSQRLLLLYAKALRAVLANGALVDCEFKALGPHGLGRQGAARLLVEILADDDQWLVEALLDLTHAAQSLAAERGHVQVSSLADKEQRSLCSAAMDLFSKTRGDNGALRPFTLFSEFCNALRFDERVFLDLLLSSETKSLEYLLRVLRLKDGAHLASIGEDSDEFKSLALLRRLRGAVVRANDHGLFPYNPRALLSRFDHFFS